MHTFLYVSSCPLKASHCLPRNCTFCRIVVSICPFSAFSSQFAWLSICPTSGCGLAIACKACTWYTDAWRCLKQFALEIWTLNFQVYSLHVAHNYKTNYMYSTTLTWSKNRHPSSWCIPCWQRIRPLKRKAFRQEIPLVSVRAVVPKYWIICFAITEPWALFKPPAFEWSFFTFCS